MDIFSEKIASPMLIGMESEPFDDSESIYELKLDGDRCLAYLDKDGLDLRSRRNHPILSRVPELSDLYKNVKERCILDGELIVLSNGRPDFKAIRNRTQMKNKLRIDLAAKQTPVTFVVFDLLYYKNSSTTDLPLMQRKELLEEAIVESDYISKARYIEQKGKEFFKLTLQQGLEGIVAKKKDSLYHIGKRTREWQKIKQLNDDEFIICGYLIRADYVASLFLGQYQGDTIVYKGRVPLAYSRSEFAEIKKQQKSTNYPYTSQPPTDTEGATWLVPNLVCTVKFMGITSGGLLRQPAFKALRPDKLASEIVALQK